MKKILFFSLMLACVFSFGKCSKKKSCSKKKKAETTATQKTASDEVWMRYDETQCANPWQFNWFTKPTPEQVMGAIKSELLGQDVHILEMRASYEKDLVTCNACECPTGTHYFVRIPTSDTDKLKALKFYETKDVPASMVKDTTQ